MLTNNSSTVVRRVSLVVSLLLAVAVLLPMVGMVRMAEAEDCIWWNVEYFNDTELEQLVSTDCEERDIFSGDTISYVWATVDSSQTIDSLPRGITNPHQFSARWKGNFNFYGGDGRYLFKYNVDDGIRVFIDNSLVLDKWTPGRGETEQNFQSGVHEIVVEYHSTSRDAAHIEFGWRRIQDSSTKVDNAELDSQSEYMTVAPGQTVHPIIRVRNSGETTWSKQEGYKWTGTGEREGQSGAIWRDVPPGDVLTFEADVVVPQQPGEYIYGFILKSPDNKNIGPHFFIKVTVVATATPTQVSTATPTPIPTTNLTPIVFVPGYWNCAVGDSERGASLPFELQIATTSPKSPLMVAKVIHDIISLNPQIKPLWGPALIPLSGFISDFLAQGYILGDNLYIACYDWSGNMKGASENLGNVLREAYSNNESSPVTIITHSTGALVTRSFIQNNPKDSQKMVKDLFLIAPPNQGVGKFYYIWEGGELNLKGLDPSFDDVDVLKGAEDRDVGAVFAPLVNELINDFTRRTLSSKCGYFGSSSSIMSALILDPKKVYECLRRMEGGQPFDETMLDKGDQLLPINTWFLPNWKFLIKGTGKDTFEDPYPNYPLKRLNNPEQVAQLFAGIQGIVHVLAGEINNDSTLYRVRTTSSPGDAPLWKNGKPDRGYPEAYMRTKGDQTIPIFSTELPSVPETVRDRYKYNKFVGSLKEVEHAEMLSNPQVLEYLHQYLNIKSKPSVLEIINNFFAVSMHSPATILVTSPSGQRFGVNGSGEFLDIPDSMYYASTDPTGEKYVYIFNPQEGNYQIEVTGIEPGGEYMLYVSSLGSESLGVRDTIAPNEVKTYNVRFVSGGECTTPGPCILANGSVTAPESSTFAAPTFQSMWQANTPLWGEAISDGMQEPYAGLPNGVRQVQYFEKSRMEINDGSQPARVTNGLLVREMIEGRVQVGDALYEERTPASEAIAGDPTASNPNAPTYASFRSVAFPTNAQRAENRVGQGVVDVLATDGSVSSNADLAHYGITLAAYDEVLGHNIPSVFTTYFAARGIDQMAVVGLPLSEPYWARVMVGGVEQEVLIQVFERRVITYNPNNPAAWQVEMGNVGSHYKTWRYNQ